MSNTDKAIYTIVEFEEYLSYLAVNIERFLIIICAKDNIGYELNKNHAEMLVKLGIKNDLSRSAGLNGCSHRGFVAVINGGNLVADILAEPRQVASFKSSQIDICSTVYSKSNGCAPAHVYIGDNGYNYIPNRRGLNFVVIDKDTNEVIDSVAFDTHVNGAPLTTRKYIKKKQGEIIEKKQLKAMELEGIDEKLYIHYREFVEKYVPKELPELRLYKPEYPFSEIAVVIGVEKSTFSDFTAREKFHIKAYNQLLRKGEVCIISTFPTRFDKNGVNYLFSGNALYNGRFIFGIDDLEKDTSIYDIQESCGEFELLIADTEKIEFCTDFFGFGKWFYYNKGNLFVAATSYHMLLLLLREVGVMLCVNTEYVIANNGTFSWINQQLFSWECEVKDVFLIPPDKKICIEVNGDITFQPTRLQIETYCQNKYDEKEYEDLLYKAKDELVENMKAILSNPRFNNVLIDITDGLDTRNILAAALNLPVSLQDKIRLNVAERPNDDFKTAQGIANMLGLHWNDIPSVCTVIRQTDGIDQSSISANLGTYYLFNSKPSTVATKYIDTIHLSGGNGETCTAIPAQLDGVMYEQSINKKIYLDRILNKHGPCTGDKLAKEYFVGIMDSNLSGSHENTAIAMDIFYQQFRNRLHFKQKYRYMPSFSPIQSISAYKAKKMSFQKQVSFTFQHDLIYVLHPLLGKFPYIEPKQTRRIKFINHFELSRYGNINVEIVPDYSRKKYDEERKRTTCYMPAKEVYEDQRSKVQHKERLYEWIFNHEDALLSCLKTIIDYIPGYERIGYDFYEFICRKSEKKYQTSAHTKDIFTSKLLSLYYQICIIK